MAAISSAKLGHWGRTNFGPPVNRLLNRFGVRITKSDFDFNGWNSAAVAVYEQVKPYTMVSRERISAFRDAIVYAERYRIPGAVVECGVWRGGSMMAAALTLRELGATRDLYLFDTFQGMNPPTAVDVDLHGQPAATLLAKGEARAYASFDDVRANMTSTGYDESRIHYVPGLVEETIPASAPSEIAVLRLDTDWYESTRHELEHLVPRLAPNGVLLVDDYGHWAGSRQAVDEFLERFDRPVLLNRTDYTGRIAVVP